MTSKNSDIAIRSQEAASKGEAWTWEDHEQLVKQLRHARLDRQALLEIERLQKAETARRVAPPAD